MGLIKAPNVPAAAAPFSMRDIEQAARGILLRARQQAEALLAEAQVEAEALTANAHAQGLAEGRQEGFEKGLAEGHAAGAQQALAEHKAQLAAATAALAAAMAQIDAGRQALEAGALREVVELAVAIARRVTKRQGAIDPDVLAANVAEALKLAVGAADVRIAVHPAQRATLAAALPQIQLALPNLKHVEITDDPTLAPGGCRVFARQGQIDADLDGQLDRVVADLLPTPESGPAAGGAAE